MYKNEDILSPPCVSSAFCEGEHAGWCRVSCTENSTLLEYPQQPGIGSRIMSFRCVPALQPLSTDCTSATWVSSSANHIVHYTLISRLTVRYTLHSKMMSSSATRRRRPPVGGCCSEISMQE